MALPLFDRELKYEELRSFAGGLGLGMLPVLENRLEEEDGAAVPVVDEGVLENVVRMLERSAFRMHVAYELQDVMAPMVSMYIYGDHMLAGVYSRRGVRFAEMFSVQDVKRLLIQSFRTFVTDPDRTEQPVCPRTVLTARELTDLLVKNRLSETAASSEERERLAALETAFAESPRLSVVIDDARESPEVWYAVKAGDGVYSVFADGEGMPGVTLGSGLPVLDAASRRFIGRYREMLKMMQEVRGKKSE